MLHHQLEDDSIQPSKNYHTQVQESNPGNVEITVEELAKAFTSDENWISKYLSNNWINNSILVLGFNRTISFDKLLSVLRNPGLDCTFACEASSSLTEDLIYLIGWQLENVVNDIQREQVIKFIEYIVLGSNVEVYKLSPVSLKTKK